MRLLLGAALFSVLGAAAIAAGCNGDVVVDGPGAGGSGGSGGGSGGSSTTVFMTSSISVVSSSNSSTGTSVTATSSNVTTTTATTSSFASSSSGPNGCDDSGQCGENGDGGCIACATQGGQCTDLYETCLGGTDCTSYIDCTNDCNGPMCQEKCAQQFPAGAQQYQQLIVCVICDACPNDCAMFGQGCPD